MFNLTYTVAAFEIVGPWAVALLSLVLFPNNDLEWGALIFFIPTVAFLYPNLTMALLSLLYFVFGDNIFIFNWVDSVLAFLIQYVVSMLTPLIYIIGIIFQLAYWGSEPNERGLITFNLIVFLLQAYYLETATMRLSVGAIRHLSPTWDMEEPGEYLWPAILYALNIKEHTGRQKASTANDSKQSSDGIDDTNDGEVVWTL